MQSVPVDCPLYRVTLITAIAFFSVSALSAQIVSLEMRHVADDVPGRLLGSSLDVSYDIGEGTTLLGRYRYLLGTREPFKGTPALRSSLATMQCGVRADLPQWGLAMTAVAGVDVGSEGPVTGNFRAAARFARPIDSIGDRPVTLRISTEAKRERMTAETSAMEQRIGYLGLSGEVGADWENRLSITAHVDRRIYSDDNEMNIGYSYLLWQPFGTQALSLGYSYSVTDTRRDNWRMTGSRFDPVVRRYTYEYSYYPYFTPVDERGHSLIGIVQASPVEHYYLYAKAAVPIVSTGQSKYMPSSGTTAVPPDAGIYYEQKGLLPMQIDVAVASDILAPLIVRVDGSYFSKPYYSSVSAGLQVQYRF